MRFLKESYNDKYVITYEKNGRQWFWKGVLDINKAELYSKEQAENILNELIAQNKTAIKYYLNKIDKDGNASLYNMFIEEYQEFIDTAKIKKVNISVNLSESVNKLQNIQIPNYYNTWSAIDSLTIKIGDEAPVTYYLMENDRYGDETFYLVVTEDLKTIYETFDDIETCLRDEEILWEHLDLDESLNETIKSIDLSKSAVVNYIMNDFELNDEFSNDFDLYDIDDEEVDEIINEIDLTSIIDWIANQGEEELEKFCNEFDLDYEHFSDYGPVNDMDLNESIITEDSNKYFIDLDNDQRTKLVNDIKNYFKKNKISYMLPSDYIEDILEFIYDLYIQDRDELEDSISTEFGLNWPKGNLYEILHQFDEDDLDEKLIQSPSKKALQKNIETEIKAGKDLKQAAAIAYSIRDEVKKKSMKEAIENEIALHYGDLPITYQYDHTVDYWDGRQWEEKDINIDWDYKVAKEDILDAIIDEVADEMYEKFIDKEYFSDSEINKYFNDNFDRLFKTYNKQILDYFKDEAIEDAEENYEEVEDDFD